MIEAVAFLNSDSICFVWFSGGGGIFFSFCRNEAVLILFVHMSGRGQKILICWSFFLSVMERGEQELEICVHDDMRKII